MTCPGDTPSGTPVAQIIRADPNSAGGINGTETNKNSFVWIYILKERRDSTPDIASILSDSRSTVKSAGVACEMSAWSCVG
jgi:hypothetical protein